MCSAVASRVLFALAVTEPIPPINRVNTPSLVTYFSDTYIILLWKILKLLSLEPIAYS